MELRHLRSFLAVAETLNFRRAAERLHVAQPALSLQIKGLEGELGVKLFERSTRAVTLTQAGRILLEEARVLVSGAQQAELRVRKADQGLVGTLRLGILSAAATAWLAGILRRFHHKYPGVQLSLFDLTSADQLKRLRAGELDAGFLRPPVLYPELDYKLIEKCPQVLALPANHRLVRKRRIEWPDFAGEGLVLMHPSQQHHYYDAFLSACAAAGAKPRVAQFANDIQSKLWLISAGFGISPTSANFSKTKRPGLVFRPLPPGLPLVETAVVWRRADTSQAMKQLLAFFKDSPHTSKGD
jgi:DNA-binding transcriptional LysR family regulator